VEIEGTKVFGQFPVDAGGAGDQWGLLFAKDNPLVECLEHRPRQRSPSRASWPSITDEWMGEYTEAPTLSTAELEGLSNGPAD
jgi:hypothetical protein